MATLAVRVGVVGKGVGLDLNSVNDEGFEIHLAIALAGEPRSTPEP